MALEITEAIEHLPPGAVEGSICRVPVNIKTGKFDDSVQLHDQNTILYYGFLRTDHQWQFLGRGLTG